MTALVPYRCEHTNGDVKFAVRPSDILILEGKAYVCVVDPDEQFDTTRFGPIEVYSAPTFTYTNLTDFSILDIQTSLSTIIISGREGNTPAVVTVAVNITHTWAWDLLVKLISPTNVEYVLHQYVSNDGTETGGNANLYSTYYVSVASEAINGTWTLSVYDDVGGDIGTLDDWSITL